MVIKRIILNLIIISLVVNLFSCAKLDNEYDNSNLLANLYKANDMQYADGYAKEIFVPSKTSNELVDNISAESYFVSSIKKSKYDFVKYKDPYKQMPIASLTKLMTALIVLKYCDDFDKKFIVSGNAVNLTAEDSKANLKVGDIVSVKDLLYGLLLPSGNDAAMTLGENLDKNIDNFIILMNNEAERIGALHTHFSNPSGLNNEHNYSTAYDLHLILRELMKYPLFYEISQQKEYTAEITQGDGNKRNETWKNTNYFVMGEMSISTNVILLAGKTGYTEAAGNCLAILSKSKKTGEDFVSVVLNANSKTNMYRNTNALLNFIDK